MTVSIATEKLKKYCAYQERCQEEVRQKLTSFKLTSDQREQVIAQLIEQNFLNEERFSEAYARGKFRMKSWGRKKIILALRQKDISDYCIKKGMLQIDENEYIATLNQLLEKNYLKHKGIKEYQRAAKTAQYAISRGFEPNLVWRQLKTITND